ncbi:MAG: MltA domain-containing protein [Rhodospirillales bacterium]|nr:MltA domain-containing protein [Rhodospirillales bacterium]
MTAVLGLAGCAQLADVLPTPAREQSPAPVSKMILFPLPFKELPGWVGDNHAQALPAFIKSCDKIEKLPKEKSMGSFLVMGKIADWIPLCASARLIRPGNKIEAQYFFESRFLPYSVRNGDRYKGLFTGYYEADLRGAFGPDNTYRFPIYAKPGDLIEADLGAFDDKFKGSTIGGRIAGNQFVPYFSRAEIEDGALSGRQLETVWVDNAIDAFILHIQGSGRVILPDGSHIRVGYAGRNGHRYTAIGRELVAAGVMRLDDVTMPAIRSWMEAHPVAALALMRKNKSFIFFQVIEGAGPIGAQGVALTPGRSLAVDRAFLPLGLPIWLDTTEPGTRGRDRLSRLVIAQDTGSAIKGPVRGDYFWGYGPEAALKAGTMKEEGEYYLLLPQSAAREYPKF